MKRNKRFIVFLGLTILWIMVIFSFSLQTGDESSQVSGGIVTWFVEMIFPAGFAYIEEVEFLIRKAAHFTEYFVLGILTSLTVRETRCMRLLLAPWLCGTAVACCDETIQLFSAGRTGQLIDVLLDSTGVFCGCGALYMIVAVLRERKRRNNYSC